MRSLMACFQLSACCLLIAACSQGDSRRDYPAPPAGSYRTESLPLTTGGTSNPVRVAFVTRAFFQAVREQPSLGRAFAAEEHQSGNREGVIILSHGLWQQRFGSDPALIGKGVELVGRAHTVVGVMPRGFDTPAGSEAWLPEAGSGR